MAMYWTTPPDVIEKLTENYVQTVFESGRNIALKQAEAMEEWAKMNAPWKDVTGRARAGLHAWVEQRGSIGIIWLSHDETLDYTKWLEIAHQGRFSILEPARDYWFPITRRAMQGMLNLKIITLEN